MSNGDLEKRAAARMGGASGRWRELRESSNPTMVALFIGVFVLEMLFITSYVGGIARPSPRQIPVGVVGPAGLARRIDSAAGHVVDARPYQSVAAGRSDISQRKIVGLFAPGAKRDLLVVAGAPTPINQSTLHSTFAPVAKASGVPLTTQVVHPLAADDPEGLASFYLAVGWAVGGYLIASLLGLARGSTPGWRGLAARLPPLLVYSAVSGILGAAIVADFMSVLPGSMWVMAGMGTLTVLAVCLTTGALQVLLGEAGGTGMAIGIFVVLGNPSAGGPYTRYYLTGIWRHADGLVPTSAATDAVRSIAYFPTAGVGGPLLVTGLWALGALVILGISATLRSRQTAGAG